LIWRHAFIGIAGSCQALIDGFGKSPDAALRGILRRCGVRKCTPHSSGLAHLACGAFYEAVEPGQFSYFLQVHN
jgi:hypothetical protein